MKPINDCSECYQQDFPECQDIVIHGGFAAGYTYKAVINTRFDDIYKKSIACTEDNKLVISKALFPSGTFNRFGGGVTITFLSEDGCTQFNPTICGGSYSCVSLNFVLMDSDVDEFVGCCGDAELVFVSVVWACEEEPPTNASITGEFLAQNGSGSYTLQIFVEGVWIDWIGNLTPSFVEIVSGSPDTAPEYLMRIKDDIKGTLSNELTMEAWNCPLS